MQIRHKLSSQVPIKMNRSTLENNPVFQKGKQCPCKINLIDFDSEIYPQKDHVD